MLKLACGLLALSGTAPGWSQRPEKVRVVPDDTAKNLDGFMGKKRLTSFLYPDALEKPVLYPLSAANGTVETQGPVNPFGDKQFTNGQIVQTWPLAAGKLVSFRHRISIEAGRTTLTSKQLNSSGSDFASQPSSTIK